jgi:hypothetical protein
VGDQPLAQDAANATLHYATPVQRLKRVRALPALFGGMFLVLVGAILLIIGFVVIAAYGGYASSDFRTALAFAVCIFSATCLLAGLPLIYRGTRADD